MNTAVTPVITAQDAKALLATLESKTGIRSKGLDARSHRLRFGSPTLAQLFPGSEILEHMISSLTVEAAAMLKVLSASRRSTMGALLNTLIVEAVRKEVAAA